MLDQDAFEKVCSEHEVTQRMGVGFGAKIVRGAYLERERQLSAKGNYPDPTNPSYEATSAVYDRFNTISEMKKTFYLRLLLFRVVEHLLEQVAVSRGKSCNVIVASHNESSVLKAVSKMATLRILPTDNTVVFGQIYGMAFNITVKLGILLNMFV